MNVSLRRPVTLFDFDGTLADSVELIVTSYRTATEAELGRTFDERLVRAWVGRPFVVMLQQEGVADPDRVMRTYRKHYLANHDTLLHRFPGMTNLLEDLHVAGARIGVVSSKPAQYVELGLRATDLLPWVDTIVGLGDTDEDKPHPGPLRYASAKLGAAVSDCLYVGDATTDVVAGAAAGMETCAVTWGASTRSELSAVHPTATVESVSDLRAWLMPPSSDQPRMDP